MLSLPREIRQHILFYAFSHAIDQDCRFNVSLYDLSFVDPASAALFIPSRLYYSGLVCPNIAAVAHNVALTDTKLKEDMPFMLAQILKLAEAKFSSMPMNREDYKPGMERMRRWACLISSAELRDWIFIGARHDVRGYIVDIIKRGLRNWVKKRQDERRNGNSLDGRAWREAFPGVVEIEAGIQEQPWTLVAGSIMIISKPFISNTVLLVCGEGEKGGQRREYSALP